MSMFATYDHTKVNISINGLALTDFNGDVTVEKEGDDWEVVEGSNGAVERSRMNRKLFTVSIPMMQTSAQLTALDALAAADTQTGAGPYAFALTDLNGVYSLFGVAWIHSMGTATKGRATVARTVTLKVKAEAVSEGA